MSQMKVLLLVLCTLQQLHLYTCCTVVKENIAWQFNPDQDTLLFDVASQEECLARCQEDSSCKGYTFEFGGVIDQCFLYQDLKEVKTCTGCISGTVIKIQAGTGCATTDSVILHDHVNSVEDCINLCANDSTCEHFIWFNQSAVFENMCALFTDCPEVHECEFCVGGSMNCIPEYPPECLDYKILDDSTRNDQHGNEEGYCDDTDSSYTSPDWEGTNWYRMMSPAGDKMRSTPGVSLHCGTQLGGWLQTEHPADFGQTQDGKICFNCYSDTCCYSKDIQVTNCGQYYVYNLVDTPCRARYCATF